MTHSSDTCRRAHQLTSAFLDGRLDAQRRGALQAHLKRCPTCMKNLRETERLARATHNLPPHRRSRDLAARVQAATQDRRRDRVAALDGGVARPGDRALRWLLLAALLMLAWSIGLHMGGDRSTATARSQPDDTFATTSRRVLGDLTFVADLPQRQRQPLLQSQLELFDLRARAERVITATAPRSAEHQLAALVLDLARALDRGDADWRGLRQRAPLPRAELARRPPSPPGRHAPLQAVLARHSERLDDDEQGELEEFLLLKQRIVSGERVTVRELSWSSNDGTANVSGFSLASGLAGVRSMIESGELEQAGQLQRRMNELLRALRASTEPRRR